jgi:outer membrane protein assembly factor BamB
MNNPAVVPVLIGPVQILITVLPYLILAALSALVSLLHPRAVLKGLKILWRQKLQVAAVLAVVVAVGIGLWYAIDWFLQNFGPQPVVAEATAGEDWPMARGGLQRRGAVPGDQAPTHGGVNWSFCRNSREAFISSPAIVGNRAYIVSADPDPFFAGGYIYCFDTDTGGLVWKFPDPQKSQDLDPRYRPTFSSPVVSGKYLVCGEGLHETNDARVICLDISNDREPKLLWTHATKNHVECTPVIWKDRVVVNAGDDGTHCLALQPGPDGKAQELWHAPGGKYLDCETSLALADGKVYLGMGFEGNGLVVFDALTGQEEKRLDVGAPVFSPASIADGKLYFVKGFADYIRNWEDARQMLVEKWEKAGIARDEIDRRKSRIGPEGTLCCVDLKTWKIDWELQTKETVLGCVAIAGDQLVCAARNGTVYVVSKAGKRIGTWNANATVVSSPAVTDKHICVVTGNGLLCVLDRENLELTWQIRLGRPTGGIKYFIGSPAVARGHVYVGTVQDGFVCVGEPGKDRPPPLWPGALGGSGRAGTVDDSSIPSNDVLSIVAQPIAPGLVKAPAAGSEGQLFVPFARGEGEGEGAGLTCFTISAADPRPSWHVALPEGVSQSPAVFGDTVWCVDGPERSLPITQVAPEAGRRKLRALNTTTGKERWQVPLGAGATGILLATADRLLVQDKQRKLSCFTHQGDRQWEEEIGELSHAPTVTKTMIVAATASPPVLLALDRPTGRVLWRRSLEAVPTTSPVVRQDRIYVGTLRGLEARSLLDGTPIDGWKVDPGGVSADFALLRDVAVYVSSQGELIVIDLEHGSVKGKMDGALAGRPPLVSRDVVLYLAKEGVMRLSLQGEGLTPQLWFDTTEVGEITSPLVLVDGRVYGGTAKKGLVRLGN